jgi:serine/threonine protein kinase
MRTRIRKSGGKHLDLRTTVVTSAQKVGRVSKRITPNVQTPFISRQNVEKSRPRDIMIPSRRRAAKTSSENIGRYLPDVFTNSSNERYYLTSRQLGEGAYSICYLVEDEQDLSMAGKFFTKKTISSRKRLEHFEREVKLMQQLNHPNIVKFYDAISGVKGNYSFADFNKGEHVSYHHPPVMFIEYCSGGSLSSFLKARAEHGHRKQKYGMLNENETLWVAYCVCRALEYLREKRILHRDIKMGNLLLQNAVKPNETLVNSGIVLCDFGLATQLKDNELLAFGTSGTPYYIAREVILHEGASYASDMWSLGVTLFYCLTGRAPFHSRSRSTSGIYRKIRHMEYRWKSGETEVISEGIRNLVNSMLSEEPVDRPTPTELLKSKLMEPYHHVNE